MNPFLRQISTIKRLARIRTVIRTVLVAVMIFLIIHALVSGLDKLGVSFIKGELPAYGIAALLSMILAIGLVVLSGNFLGDWLRDRLDPRLRQL